MRAAMVMRTALLLSSHPRLPNFGANSVLRKLKSAEHFNFLCRGGPFGLFDTRIVFASLPNFVNELTLIALHATKKSPKCWCGVWRTNR